MISRVPLFLRRFAARFSRWLPVAALALWFGASATLEAQGPETPAADPEVTLEMVQERKKAWEAATLDAAVKQSVLALATEAETQLQQKAQAVKDTATFRARAEELPARVAELKKAPPPENGETRPAGEETLESLEVAAARAREAVEAARQVLTEARDLPRRREARRKELAAAVSDLSARLAKAREERTAAPAGVETEVAELAEARALSRAAALGSAQARLEAAQAELAFYDAEEGVGWAALAQENAAAKLQAAREREQVLQNRVKEARSRSASDSLAAAAEREAGATGETRPVLEQVTRLAEENRRVVEELIPFAELRLERLETDIRRWMETSVRTREKIRRLGASGVIGLELRQQRQRLPSRAALNAAREKLQEELNEVEATRLRFEEELNVPPPPGSLAEANPEAVEALKARREALTELLKNYGQYFNTLVRLDEADRRLASVVAAHREFIHEQILWMPSALPGGDESARGLAASLRWMREGMAELPAAWWAGIRAAPWSAGFIAPTLVVTLFLLRRDGRVRLREQARRAAKPDAGFPPTAMALGWTLLLALPWPALLWFAAQPWRLGGATDSFAEAWASGMERAALVLLGLEIMRGPLRSNGLAEAHFQWRPEHLRPLRRQLLRLTAIVVPAVWLGTVFRNSEQQRHDGAERLCLLIVLLASAWWLHRFWKRGRAIRRESAGDPAAGGNLKFIRLSWWLGHALSVFTPLALVVLAVKGYLYTAQVLAERLTISVLAGAGFLLARALFFRWYRLHRRRLRSARAKQLREARETSRAAAATAAAASSATGDPASTQGAGAAPAAGSELAPDVTPDGMTGPDIDEIGLEMRQLVEVIFFLLMAGVLWLVWADVLPAAQKLSNQPLESFASFVVPDAATANGGASAVSPAPAASAVKSAAEVVSPALRASLADVLIAIAAAALTFMAARRIPGALQFVLSSQIKLDPGLRFALGTVTRYLIVIAGVVFVLGTLGLAWSHVQWLAAALTVGLGFGLQEIFANFFSGLIILFERPIRPGDVVTIDNVTGTVTRIQIRATTIRTGDYTEYIVPNREFITGKLLNWTRTDTINRMTIEFGVSYKEDLAKALEILRRVVSEYPLVLKEPAPTVSCEGFMDGSVKLVARYYLATLDHRLAAMTDLHRLISKEFVAAGIEMPSPGREVYLRSLPPGREEKRDGLAETVAAGE